MNDFSIILRFCCYELKIIRNSVLRIKLEIVHIDNNNILNIYFLFYFNLSYFSDNIYFSNITSKILKFHLNINNFID